MKKWKAVIQITRFAKFIVKRVFKIIITWCALNVVIIWIELQVRVSFMKWTIIVDFKRYKDFGVDTMDPVTAIQTGLYHSFYEHIIVINMVEW